MKTYIYNKVLGKAKRLTLPLGMSLSILCFASCSDMLEQDSDKLVFTDEATLTQATDTIYSVTGIINKMQAIADRTILLGEVRGDLTDINNNTASDLRDVALFNVGEGNKYNSLREYYAIINNCNYYIAKADTAVKNQRNEYLFMKEYAAVKAFRAWTYLQMAVNYGTVEFITEPVLTKEESDREYPVKDIQGICDYFIQDLTGLENIETPGYGTIRNTDSHLFYFPIYILLGDLNLWAGNYKEASLCYYKYLTNRDNKTNAVSPTNIYRVKWAESDSHWNMKYDSWSSNCFENETSGDELITMIPGDSIPSEGNYSQLRNLFNTSDANDYKESLDPSKRIQEISASQKFCHINSEQEVSYAPDDLKNYQTGDLRLSSIWGNMSNLSSFYLIGDNGSSTIDIKNIDNYSSIGKYSSRNVHIYRLTMVYLRMAEALNRAGYPRFAYAILSSGVNNNVLKEDVIPYYPTDSAWISQFDFPTTSYKLQTKSELSNENTMGIHSHGSGFTPANEYYTYPEGSDEITAVEDLIMQEEALEFAFEGYRYYDLMRIALRRNDPAYLADHIYQRKGIDNVAEMKSLIKVDLYDKSNWYLKKQ